MNEDTVFRVIDRRKHQLWAFQNVKSLEAFFFGRRTDHFMLIKSDNKGDRVVSIEKTLGDVKKIIELARAA